MTRHPKGRPRACAAAATFALAALLAPSAGASALTPEEERGREIFRNGKSPSGDEIVALIGEGVAAEIPGEMLPCASCHGEDGRGRAEGGAEPTDLTWASLSRPYEVEGSGARRHPAYDTRLLIRAVTMGVDPGGNPLSVAMPRYRLSKADAEALAAYIRRLGTEAVPGVSESAIRVGTIVPAGAHGRELGEVVEKVLAARFAEVNDGGGIYGRRLELAVARSGEDPADRRRALGELVAGGPEGAPAGVFALVGPWAAGAEEALAAAAEEAQVPVVGPVTPNPWAPSLPPPHTFYLLSGGDQLAAVLWDWAAGRLPADGPGPAVVAPDDPAAATAVEAVRRQAERWQRPPPEVLSFPPGAFDPAATAGRLAGRAAVLFLGDGRDAARLADAIEVAGGRRPEVLLPAPFAGPLLAAPPAGFALAFPSLPGDATPAARREWTAFAERRGLPPGQLLVQRLAAAAADLLVEGLRQAGRELTREKLVTLLEGLYRHETGLTPPLSYGKNRRIGALGGYVARFDGSGPEPVEMSGWIEPKG